MTPPGHMTHPPPFCSSSSWSVSEESARRRNEAVLTWRRPHICFPLDGVNVERVRGEVGSVAAAFKHSEGAGLNCG